MVSAEVVPYLDWPGAAQVARIERIREIGGKVSADTAYVVTSLTAAEAGPERLLDLSRGHWAIENRLHYVRDVTFNEDRCRVRSGARALAAIRNLVLHLIRSRGMAVPEARENFGRIAPKRSPSSPESFFEWPWAYPKKVRGSRPPLPTTSRPLLAGEAGVRAGRGRDRH